MSKMTFKFSSSKSVPAKAQSFTWVKDKLIGLDILYLEGISDFMTLHTVYNLCSFRIVKYHLIPYSSGKADDKSPLPLLVSVTSW